MLRDHRSPLTAMQLWQQRVPPLRRYVLVDDGPSFIAIVIFCAVVLYAAVWVAVIAGITAALIMLLRSIRNGTLTGGGLLGWLAVASVVIYGLIR